VTQTICNSQSGHGCDGKTFEGMTLAQPLGTLDSVASLLVATLYPDINHKLWNIG